MGKPLTGSILKVDGKLYARVQYVEVTGRRREIRRRADNRTHARALLAEIIAKLQSNAAAVHAERLTFAHLATTYESEKLRPPVYRGAQRVSGVRSWKDLRNRLAILVQAFGAQNLHEITPRRIEEFRTARLAGITRRRAVRSIASVNRELALLRACLAYAVAQGWLARNPFASVQIGAAQEVQRERILTADEECRLLAACTGKRAHLRALILAALDTAARRGELFRLQWGEVDFDAGLITLRAENTKTERARLLGITERLHDALRAIVRTDDRVFPFRTIRTAWESACALAELHDLRFHDLRHTAITRMVRAGIAPGEVMTVSGHTQPATFARYVNTDADTARRIVAALKR